MPNQRLTKFPRDYKDIPYSNEFKVGKRWYYDGKKYITGSLNSSLTLDCFISDSIFAQKIIPEIKSSSDSTTIRLIDCICHDTYIFKNLLTPAAKETNAHHSPLCSNRKKR